jgi:hypothetical protein
MEPGPMVSAVVCGCVLDLPLPRFFTANGRTHPSVTSGKRATAHIRTSSW